MATGQKKRPEPGRAALDMGSPGQRHKTAPTSAAHGAPPDLDRGA
jgi:hypothetical protein